MKSALYTIFMATALTLPVATAAHADNYGKDAQTGVETQSEIQNESGAATQMNGTDNANQASGAINWNNDTQATADTPDPMNQTDHVLKAQRALSSEGYNPGSIDGVFGPSTAEAVKRFQRDNQLSETGRLDNQTLSELGVEVSNNQYR